MEDFEAAALAVLDTYLDALNARDSAAMRACFHFPHYRFPGGRVEVFETAEDYGIDNFLVRDDTRGWARTDWDHRKMVHGDAGKVHFDVQFTRYRADGSVLGTYQSLWVVTNRDGKWGVMARSSYAG
ncbi:MAG: hypothetical protein QF578_22745 [Alphaproteobacteria bacterium]|jgi:hypothetical protein|nr:hypothetical protein [Alphaproteobacteria bacterium]MDP6567664.1 hypothetical protein [Alphaproteobacteria bacterium]MDP6813200.1 hypothetical protein [Alphaproteobacteria bacterium]